MFEAIHRLQGITREHCHGGKFNGVNCMRIMEKAKILFVGDGDMIGGFLEKCLLNREERVTEEHIERKMKDYEELLGMMDSIWSQVRGVSEGLLPTKEEEDRLDESITNFRSKKLGALQPKWHLTFDGHLQDQYKQWGGLADKADDSTEAFHQTLMRLRERFRGSKTYKQKEQSIRKELRRKRSAKIQSHIDEYESKMRRPTTTKRSIEARERKEDKKRIKQKKRDGHVDGFVAIAM